MALAGQLNCCLHIGMHKTGTSSIQETFCQAEQGRVRVIPEWHANNGGAISTLYQDEPWRLRVHRLAKRTQHDVKRIRKRQKGELYGALTRWREDIAALYTGDKIVDPIAQSL